MKGEFWRGKHLARRLDMEEGRVEVRKMRSMNAIAASRIQRAERASPFPEKKVVIDVLAKVSDACLSRVLGSCAVAQCGLQRSAKHRAELATRLAALPAFSADRRRSGR